MNRQQPNPISKTIQDFNRQCAEEKVKRSHNTISKYQKRIQSYRMDLSAKLGEGSFSKVYTAKDEKKDTTVAIKIVQLKKIQEMGIEDLFWEQINIIRKLKHPNVVNCIEYFKTTNNCYTVYEFCQGGDLSRRLKKGHLGDKEDISQANVIIKDVFQGLLYLQSMSIVHRDIKAANILLDNGKAKIGDFGFATHCKRQFKDVSIGSPAYMAPEGLLSNIYGPKTDVWSFGMLLFQIMHGQTPFHNCQSQAELKERVQIQLNWDQLKASLPSPLKRLILKCLKVKSSQRPTFSQLLNDQYIQKIYQQSGSRHPSKSNCTKITSDSQNSQLSPTRKNYPRLSVSPFTPKKQRLLSMEKPEYVYRTDMATIKTKPQEEVEDFAVPSLFETINISEVIDLATKKLMSIEEQLKQVQTQREVGSFILKENILEKFLILTQQSYTLQSLQKYLKIVKIFKETLHLIKIVHKKQQTSSLTLFTNQLLLETYQKALYSSYDNIVCQIQQSKDLLSYFQKEKLLEHTESKPYQSVCDQLFQLIKLSETAIDRQDILEHTTTSHQQSKLVYSGNILIIALQLIYTIQNNQSPQQWINNHTSNLHSSDQFFIWLYELQLKRMQLPQS